MAKRPPKSFTHILVGDVIKAQKRLSKSNTASNKRDYVRTVFSTIEGLHWQLKSDVRRHSLVRTKMTMHEVAAQRAKRIIREDGFVAVKR